VSHGTLLLPQLLQDLVDELEHVLVGLLEAVGGNEINQVNHSLLVAYTSINQMKDQVVRSTSNWHTIINLLSGVVG
jgi:hypothetical protein